MMHTLLAAGLLALGFTDGFPLKVDVNPPLGRSDLLTPEWENWTVSGAEASQRFNEVKLTIRSEAPLESRWYKPFLGPGSTVVSDGVAARGWIELTIEGLKPGRHSLLTYHNDLGTDKVPAIRVGIVGQAPGESVEPSRRARNDADGAVAYLEFTVEGARPVKVRLDSTAGPTGEVVLNGLEIDSTDLRRRATRPVPTDRDEHADADSGSLPLSWQAPASARAFDVYLGDNRESVASADRSSPLYHGRQAKLGLTVSPDTNQRDHYWRVDTIDASGSVARGDVWRYGTRHLAFPGAEGYGRFARGGRGGRVIEVTNLDDAGPGSFRAAVDAEGPRTIVFRVSGVISLKSPIAMKHPYLTVAGQTAPGDGICLRGYSVGTASGSTDIIIRYLRIRVGDESGHPYNGTGLGGDHSIMDHCSISWSMDEGLSTRTGRNVTFQRSIISEALDDSVHRHPHAYAASIGGRIASFHHNLLAHCTARNWSLAGGLDYGGHFDGYLDIRNNVVYNWVVRTCEGGAKEVNFVGNYYKPGPASKVFWLLKPDVGSPGDRQRYHVEGNILEGHPEYDADNWAGVIPVSKEPIALTEIRSETPFFPSYVTTTSASVAYRDVLNDVGANAPAYGFHRSARDPRGPRRPVHLPGKQGTHAWHHRQPDRPRPQPLARLPDLRRPRRFRSRRPPRRLGAGPPY